MSEKPKHFKGFLIALSALTIIELFILVCVFTDARTTISTALLLLIPFFLLLLYAICIIIRCLIRRNVWDRYIIAWGTILLLLIPISYGINKWYMNYNYSSVFVELPDGDTLTVTSDKVIFGKCDNTKNIHKDYIDLRYECHNYSITLTQDDTLYIWTENDSLPAKIHNLRYPVGKIYAGYREDEYKNAIIKKKMKWMFEYDFMYDGFLTGGTQILNTRIGNGDSLCVKIWMHYSPVYIGDREYMDSTIIKDNFGDSIAVE